MCKLYKSQDYKRMDNFPTIPDLQMTISAVGLCHFHVAENKTPLPRHRSTFRAEWKAVPDGIIRFPQATTHQLPLLRPWVLDKNNFIRTWTWTIDLVTWFIQNIYKDRYCGLHSSDRQAVRFIMGELTQWHTSSFLWKITKQVFFI